MQVPTFFSPADKASPTAIAALDTDTQAEHALFLARSGITGIVLLGSTGEAVHVAARERAGLIARVRSALDDAGFVKYPLMAGTATQSVEETVVLLSDARAAGADWGLVLAPGYFATNVGQDGIENWFKSVADQSPMPILV
jgi:2-keto-3-deoxy-L-rhamnonate aldolase